MKDRTATVFWRVAALLWASAFCLDGCGASPGRRDDPVYLEEIAKWREERVERLKNAAGWLSLAGLYWLEEGENRLGTDSTNAIVLPAGKAPAFVGTITKEGGVVEVTIAPGVEVLNEGEPVTSLVLHHDQEEGRKPTVLTHGSLSWYAIERSGRLGIRVKDAESRALNEFQGIGCFPVDARWRIEGVLEPHDPPKTIEITNVLGVVSHEPSPGVIVFEIGGKTCRLDPIAEPADEELFVVFGDATNGKETYGGGRFLYVGRPDQDGKVVLDFNKAQNPPCAFTPFATCPLPPSQNRLSLAVRAGEKAYEKPGH